MKTVLNVALPKGRLGEKVYSMFEAAGFETIHIKEILNQPNFSGAYATSRAAVEKVLKENPTVAEEVEKKVREKFQFGKKDVLTDMEEDEEFLEDEE